MSCSFNNERRLKKNKLLLYLCEKSDYYTNNPTGYLCDPKIYYLPLVKQTNKNAQNGL